MSNKEYKTLTSNTPLFKHHEKMRTVLVQEAVFGWDLEEKLDNYKIRVSRDKSARDNDKPGSNPYRTEVGINNVLYLAGAAVVTIIVIYAIIQAAAMSV